MEKFQQPIENIEKSCLCKYYGDRCIVLPLDFLGHTRESSTSTHGSF